MKGVSGVVREMWGRLQRTLWGTLIALVAIFADAPLASLSGIGIGLRPTVKCLYADQIGVVRMTFFLPLRRALNEGTRWGCNFCVASRAISPYLRFLPFAFRKRALFELGSEFD